MALFAKLKTNRRRHCLWRVLQYMAMSAGVFGLGWLHVGLGILAGALMLAHLLSLGRRYYEQSKDARACWGRVIVFTEGLIVAGLALCLFGLIPQSPEGDAVAVVVASLCGAAWSRYSGAQLRKR